MHGAPAWGTSRHAADSTLPTACPSPRARSNGGRRPGMVGGHVLGPLDAAARGGHRQPGGCLPGWCAPDQVSRGAWLEGGWQHASCVECLLLWPGLDALLSGVADPHNPRCVQGRPARRGTMRISVGHCCADDRAALAALDSSSSAGDVHMVRVAGLWLISSWQAARLSALCGPCIVHLNYMPECLAISCANKSSPIETRHAASPKVRVRIPR